MEQNGGELVNWVTSALVNLYVKERPPFILVSSLRSPFSSSRSHQGLPAEDIPARRLPSGSTDISSPFLAFTTIVQARVTDCNGIPRDTRMHSQLVVHRERGACKREPSSEVEEICA